MQKKLLLVILINSALIACNSGNTQSTLAASENDGIVDQNIDYITLLYGNYQSTTSSSAFATTSGSPASIRASYYNWVNFVAAYKDLSSNNPTDTVTLFNAAAAQDSLRDFAAFLANANQETNSSTQPSFDTNGNLAAAGEIGVPYGLSAMEEGSCYPSGCTDYGVKADYCNSSSSKDNISSCFSGGTWLPAIQLKGTNCEYAQQFCANTQTPDGGYFGRGALQLTYASNYLYYGSKISPLNPTSLADNPNQMHQNGKLLWETALAYWSIPLRGVYSTKSTPHEMMVPNDNTLSSVIVTANNNRIGFGQAINIINGGVECGVNSTHVRIETLNRINNYLELLLRLNVNVKQVDVITDLAQYTYTASAMLANINDPLHKSYLLNNQSAAVDYTLIEPSWSVQWGTTGLYDSLPLLQEHNYYYSTGATTVTTNLTSIKQITLTYSDGSVEQLDCVGLKNYSEIGG
jgi:hypothetical protein